MYNLLIVDDEKIISEGIYELLSMEEDLELNLFLASSAIEAMKILEHRKIDIVLTDINMPKMSGIELFDNIQEKWPYCKVIFLTGYSDFDYVYKVQKYARYILKAEEDEKIIEAVSEAIEEIENDFMLEQFTIDGGSFSEQKREQDRSRFLYDLLNGFIDFKSVTGDLLVRLGIQLDLTKPIYYAVMRHYPIIKESYDDQIKIYGDLQLLLEKYFFDQMMGVAFHYTRNYIVLLVQPKGDFSVDGNILSLKAKSELFQKACLKNFDMTASIVIGGKPMNLNSFLNDFQQIKNKLIVAGDEALLIIKDPDLNRSQEEIFDEQQLNIVKSKLELLDYYFENSNKEHILSLLIEARSLFKNKNSMDDLFGVEIYSDIAVRLLKYINRFEISDSDYNKIEANKLFNFSVHRSWSDAFDYLISISQFLFDYKTSNQAKSNDNVIQEVKNYIYDNLSGDTSLDNLSALVGLCPEYLLRLFKKSEGVTILQYINDLKIIKAKKLISDNTRQIKEIAYDLGFSSSGYFGRFFKSKTGLSPQGYRDKQEKR